MSLQDPSPNSKLPNFNKVKGLSLVTVGFLASLLLFQNCGKQNAFEMVDIKADALAGSELSTGASSSPVLSKTVQNLLASNTTVASKNTQLTPIQNIENGPKEGENFHRCQTRNFNFRKLYSQETIDNLAPHLKDFKLRESDALYTEQDFYCYYLNKKSNLSETETATAQPEQATTPEKNVFIYLRSKFENEKCYLKDSLGWSVTNIIDSSKPEYREFAVKADVRTTYPFPSVQQNGHNQVNALRVFCYTTEGDTKYLTFHREILISHSDIAAYTYPFIEELVEDWSTEQILPDANIQIPKMKAETLKEYCGKPDVNNPDDPKRACGLYLRFADWQTAGRSTKNDLVLSFFSDAVLEQKAKTDQDQALGREQLKENIALYNSISQKNRWCTNEICDCKKTVCWNAFLQFNDVNTSVDVVTSTPKWSGIKRPLLLYQNEYKGTEAYWATPQEASDFAKGL